MKGWSGADDASLRRCLHQANGKQAWNLIALAAFPDQKYSEDDCMERWRTLSTTAKEKPNRGGWSGHEDDQLLALVKLHGYEKWVVISNTIGTRTGKQCRERWHNHLDPKINKGEWTKEEDATIHRLYAKIGSKWAEMAKALPGRPDNAIKNYWNAGQIRIKRAKGDSMSSIASVASAASSKASAVSGSATPETSSSAMTKSTSTSRFKPYEKSSPMSKSRSEQFSPTTAFSPHRKGSISIQEGVNGSPLKSPLGMSRSQSLSAFATPSSTLTKTRSTRNSSISSIHALAQPQPRRDLTKDVFDQHSPKLALQQYRSQPTPPATPDISAYPNRRSEFPFYSPANSTATSPSIPAYHQPSVQQVFDMGPLESYHGLEPFRDLRVSEESYSANQSSSTLSASILPYTNETSPCSSTSDLARDSDSSEHQPYSYAAPTPESPQTINVHPHHQLPNLENFNQHHQGMEGGQWGDMLTSSEPTFAYPNSPQQRHLYPAQHQSLSLMQDPSQHDRQFQHQPQQFGFGYRAPYLDRSESEGSEMQDVKPDIKSTLKGGLAPSPFLENPLASGSSSPLIESNRSALTSSRKPRISSSRIPPVKLMDVAINRPSIFPTFSSSSSTSYGGQSSEGPRGESSYSVQRSNGSSLQVDPTGRATLPAALLLNNPMH